MDIYSQKLPVRFGDIDKSDGLTIAQVFDLFQEAAISHAEILGVGRDALRSSGQGWVISRIKVEMKSRPRFAEQIEVRTWPRGSHKLFAVRDYEILAADGSQAVRGRSGWLILDIEKRRPLRPDPIMGTLPQNDGVNAFGAADNIVMPALPAREFSGGAQCRRRACYSDIDYNGHVNNARYVEWIQDVLDIQNPRCLENAAQIAVEINYLAEVFPGDEVELFCTPLPASESGAFAAEGRRGSDAVFRAEVKAQ